MAPPRLPRDGDIVDGRYRLGRYLGGGGFGAAYEATSLKPPHQRVVIKFANPGVTDTLGREIEVAFELEHQHIVSYIDRREDPVLGAHLVMKHAGSSLSTILEKGERRGVDFAVTVIEAVAQALDYAHDRDVLHQDVKPANIMIDESRRLPSVRIGDFGISQRGRAEINTEGAHTVVGTGPIGYSAPYASPEQRQGRPAKRYADQYSLALVFCALLEGRELPIGYHMSAFPELSARQLAAVRQALSPDPDDRFSRCSEFARELRGT